MSAPIRGNVGIATVGAQTAQRLRLPAVALATVVLAGLVFRQLRAMARVVAAPSEWDFLCFWTWGRVAIEGGALYGPIADPALAAGRSPEFISQIIDVGFWYPPQSMLLFVPLGWFEPQAALVGWYVLHTAAAAACVWLLWRMFAPSSGALGLATVAVLLLAMRATMVTFWYAQTNFLALLAVLAVWRDRSLPRAGVWAALALVVKPYLLICLAFLFVFRNWRSLPVFAAVAAGLVVVTGALFGFDSFVAYALDNPIAKAPAFIHTEWVNQSLNATMLRATGMVPGALPSKLAGAALAGLVTVPTLWAGWRVHRAEPLLACALLLALTLVCYPMALEHYSVLLLAPLGVVWSMRSRAPGGPVAAAGAALAVVAAGYVLPEFWVRLSVLVGLGFAAQALPILPAAIERPTSPGCQPSGN